MRHVAGAGGVEGVREVLGGLIELVGGEAALCELLEGACEGLDEARLAGELGGVEVGQRVGLAEGRAMGDNDDPDAGAAGSDAPAAG